MSDIDEILFSLDKTYILERVTQEAIFELYLGLPVDVNTSYKAPYRKDNYGGARYYYKNDILRFNDWGYFHGDCFDYVGFVINEDSKTKEGFKNILEHIAKTFKLHKYKNKITKEYLVSLIKKYKQQPKPNLKKTIVYTKRNWSDADYNYWTKKYKLTYQELLNYKVYPCYTASVISVNLDTGSKVVTQIYNYEAASLKIYVMLMILVNMV